MHCGGGSAFSTEPATPGESAIPRTGHMTESLVEADARAGWGSRPVLSLMSQRLLPGMGRWLCDL